MSPFFQIFIKISDLVQPDTSLAIVRIDAKGWELTEDIMLAQKQLPREIDLKAILKPVEGGGE